MKLEINEECIANGYSKYFASWTRNEFSAILAQIQSARIKKDGTFYKRDKEFIYSWTNRMYLILKSRFIVDEAENNDERDTVLRMLDTLSAKDFYAFATIFFEPYANLEDNVSIVFEE